MVSETATLDQGTKGDGGGGEGSGVGGENGEGEEEAVPENGVICGAGEGDGWDGEQTWCAQVGVVCCDGVWFGVVWCGVEGRQGKGIGAGLAEQRLFFVLFFPFLLFLLYFVCRLSYAMLSLFLIVA